MTDRMTPRTEDESEDTLGQLVANRPEPTGEIAAAVAEVAAARTELETALDDLSDATHSALDVPAKVRRNPGKTVALIGGTGFLLAGGPRRLVRFVARRVLPQPRPDPYAGILPAEIEKVLKDSGVAKDPEVRRALNRDFANYLRQKGKYGPPPHPAASFWRTFDKVAGPLGTASARIMVQRLMEAEQDRSVLRAEARQRALDTMEPRRRSGKPS